MEEKHTDKLFYASLAGLEKESLRVDAHGNIVHTPHPFQNNPQIKMDFAENQVEIATPPCASADALYDTLYRLHKTVIETVQKSGEQLWALSAPPLFGSEQSIPIAQFAGDPEETEFREYLAEKYGRKVMLYSGIHYNFSYGDDLLRTLAGKQDLRAFKDALYLKVAKYAFKYTWFLIYLTAASPLYHESFLDGEALPNGRFSGYASMRNSPYGYRNPERLSLDLNSAAAYVDSIRAHVKAGRLKHVSELYAPVRIKAKKGHSTKAILRDGIEFIELRMFDLNPFSPCGFARDDLHFLHLFMLYLLHLPDFDFDDAAQAEAAANQQSGARFDPDTAEITLDGETRSLRASASAFAAKMRAYFAAEGEQEAVDLLDRVFERITHPETRYAARLMQTQTPFIEHGMRLTEQQAEICLRG